jgi:hypothetical protein
LRRPSGRGRSPTAGDCHLTVGRRSAARFLRRPFGRGRSSIAGDCHLTVSGPVGPAVLATATRAEARVLGAAWPSIAGDCHLAACRLASHTALSTLPGRRRAAPSVDCSLPLPADRTVASVCSHRARACSRAGTETVFSPPATRPALVRVLCTHRMSGGHATTPIGSSPHRTRASRPTHPTCTTHEASGRAGPGSGRPPHHPTGRLLPASAFAAAVSPVDGPQRSGRCGVLTRLPVGRAHGRAGPGPDRVPTGRRAGPGRTSLSQWQSAQSRNASRPAGAGY